jgi:hypothetical protein
MFIHTKQVHLNQTRVNASCIRTCTVVKVFNGVHLCLARKYCGFVKFFFSGFFSHEVVAPLKQLLPDHPAGRNENTNWTCMLACSWSVRSYILSGQKCRCYVRKIIEVLAYRLMSRHPWIVVVFQDQIQSYKRACVEMHAWLLPRGDRIRRPSSKLIPLVGMLDNNIQWKILTGRKNIQDKFYLRSLVATFTISIPLYVCSCPHLSLWVCSYTNSKILQKDI